MVSDRNIDIADDLIKSCVVYQMVTLSVNLSDLGGHDT